uniref:FBA_2 domain-containing protein n=1 Tax=Caenorhabditis tropicalis TaxID=1561998 RepID=A0A1I7UGR4_9PELO
MVPWPSGLKFEVKEIEMGSINPKILDCFVLAKPVEVVHMSHLKFDHSIIRNSEKLVISDLQDLIEKETIFAKLPNQWVHISKITGGNQQFLKFIRLIIIEWKTAKRGCGTRLSAGYSDGLCVPAVLKSIEEEFQGEYLSSRAIKIPLCHSTSVYISFFERICGNRLEMKII